MSSLSSPPDGPRMQPEPVTAEVRAVLERFARETRESYVREARVWSLRLGINAIHLAPEGAVNAAWVVLCKRLQQGKVRSIGDREDFDKVFTLLLFHVLVSERRRQHARKRGRDAGEAVYLSALEAAGFDTIDQHARPAGERAGEDEQALWLVDLLRGEGERLRAVALLKMEGLTNREIASTLDRPIWEVKRNLDKIRTILRPLLDDRG